MLNLFHQEALDHKRRRLHGEIILMQPLGFCVTTAVFFVLTLVAVWFLASLDYARKKSIVGYTAPSSGVTPMRSDRGGRLVQMFGQVGMDVEVGTPLFESQVSTSLSNEFVRPLISSQL